LKEFHSL